MVIYNYEYIFFRDVSESPSIKVELPKDESKHDTSEQKVEAPTTESAVQLEGDFVF